MTAGVAGAAGRSIKVAGKGWLKQQLRTVVTRAASNPRTAFVARHAGNAARLAGSGALGVAEGAATGYAGGESEDILDATAGLPDTDKSSSRMRDEALFSGLVNAGLTRAMLPGGFKGGTRDAAVIAGGIAAAEADNE